MSEWPHCELITLKPPCMRGDSSVIRLLGRLRVLRGGRRDIVDGRPSLKRLGLIQERS